jgi:hypothetical protein
MVIFLARTCTRKLDICVFITLKFNHLGGACRYGKRLDLNGQKFYPIAA